MLLIEFTLDGGSLQRISNQDIALTHQWFSYVRSFSSFKMECAEKYGGYAKPTFSDLELSPELFDVWPPTDATIKVMWSEDTEANAITIFDGTAYPVGYTQEYITYAISQPEFDYTVAEGTSYSNTLVNVVSSLCTSLGLTLDSTNARSTSPGVIYTTTSEVQAIDLLSDMCAYFTHGFYVDGSTLYLYDMLGTYTATELTEFDVLPCEYEMDDRISLVSSDLTSVTGTFPNGDEEDVGTDYTTNTTNAQTALTNIKSILDKDIITINTKIDSDKPMIFGAYTLTDESLVQDITSTGLVYSAIYNFDDLGLQLESFGDII